VNGINTETAYTFDAVGNRLTIKHMNKYRLTPMVLFDKLVKGGFSMFGKNLSIVVILLLSFLFLCCNEKECLQETKSIENIVQPNKEGDYLNGVAAFLSTIECKVNYKSEKGERGPFLKRSELFAKLEKNPKLTCFLKYPNILISLHNYETFIRSVCEKNPRLEKECREAAEEALYCMKPRYSKVAFFHLSIVYDYSTLVERTEQIFVDGQTGELIDELVQEIDNESCKGPFYDKDGNKIKE